MDTESNESNNVWALLAAFTLAGTAVVASAIHYDFSPDRPPEHLLLRAFQNNASTVTIGDSVYGVGTHRPAGGACTEVSAFKPTRIDDKGKFNAFEPNPAYTITVCR